MEFKNKVVIVTGVRAGWDLNAVPNLKLGEKSLRGKMDNE